MILAQMAEFAAGGVTGTVSGVTTFGSPALVLGASSPHDVTATVMTWQDHLLASPPANPTRLGFVLDDRGEGWCQSVALGRARLDEPILIQHLSGQRFVALAVYLSTAGPRSKAEQTVYNETRLEVLEKIEARDPELREPENHKFREICKDLDMARKDEAKGHAKRSETQQASPLEPAPEKLSAVDRRRQAKAGRGGTAEKTGRRDKGLSKGSR